MDDPPGHELLQSMYSLFRDNYHNIPGAGDCDCLTITACTAGLAADMDCKIVIVGNKPGEYSHVYAQIDDGDGPVKFDLTAPSIDTVNFYRFAKIISL